MHHNGAATRSAADVVWPEQFNRIAVIGGGAWGTALALTAHRAGRRVALWAREAHVVAAIADERRNPFLPMVELPRAIRATDDLRAALSGAELALLVVPSQHLRAVAARVGALLPAGVPVVLCSKGIEEGTHLLMSQVVEEVMPRRPFAVLSGPTFAAEVAKEHPTAVTVAAPLDGPAFTADHLAARIAATLATPHFRPYLSDDVIGVEIGGAMKNILAIACGIAAGRGQGANTRAMLITRGLAEITRMALALGGRADTLAGLAGAGDLLLTCSSELSRNFSFGRALGEGDLPLIDRDGPVVEGAVNARVLASLAAELGVELPICGAVDAVLRGEPMEEALDALMSGALKAEPLHLADGPCFAVTEAAAKVPA